MSNQIPFNYSLPYVGNILNSGPAYPPGYPNGYPSPYPQQPGYPTPFLPQPGYPPYPPQPLNPQQGYYPPTQNQGQYPGYPVQYPPQQAGFITPETTENFSQQPKNRSITIETTKIEQIRMEKTKIEMHETGIFHPELLKIPDIAFHDRCNAHFHSLLYPKCVKKVGIVIMACDPENCRCKRRRCGCNGCCNDPSQKNNVKILAARQCFWRSIFIDKNCGNNPAMAALKLFAKVTQDNYLSQVYPLLPDWTEPFRHHDLQLDQNNVIDFEEDHLQYFLTNYVVSYYMSRQCSFLDRTLIYFIKVPYIPAKAFGHRRETYKQMMGKSKSYGKFCGSNFCSSRNSYNSFAWEYPFEFMNMYNPEFPHKWNRSFRDAFQYAISETAEDCPEIIIPEPPRCDGPNPSICQQPQPCHCRRQCCNGCGSRCCGR